MEILNKLITIIETSTDNTKAMDENIELWKYFYDNRVTIISQNLLNEQLFTIIKFLLANENGKIFQYFSSNILKTLDFYQKQLCFNIRNKNDIVPDNIEALFNNLKYHDELSSYLDTLKLEDDLGEIKTYQSKSLELDTIDALIVKIHDQFFELNPIVVKKTIDYISKNKILFEVDRLNKVTMYNDLIFQYIEKLLPVKEYLGEELKTDPLITKITTEEIKNKKFLQQLQKNLSISQFLNIIDYDLEKFIAFLDKIDYMDEYEKQILVNQVLDKLLKDRGQSGISSLLSLIAKNNESNLWKNYITEEKKEWILTKFTTSIDSVLAADEESLNYILDIDSIDINFIKNLNYLLSNENALFCQEKNVSKLRNKITKALEQNFELISKYKEIQINPTDEIEKKILKSGIYDLTGRIIDQSTAVTLLKEFLMNKIELEPITLEPIIRSLIINILKSMELSINAVCFDQDNNYNGSYFPSSEVITLNSNLLTNLLDKNKNLYKRLKIFYVMFHEMKHCKQENDIKQSKLNINSYEMQKEIILEEYNKSFYKDNYLKVIMEIDARVSGYEMFSKFIETFYPDLLDKIQDELIKDLEIEQKFQKEQEENNQIELFQNKEIYFEQAFDNLVKYHSNLIKEYPLFQLEYHLDGTPKTDEEIFAQQTEENAKFINDIIERRKKLQILNSEQKKEHYMQR